MVRLFIPTSHENCLIVLNEGFIRHKLIAQLKNSDMFYHVRLTGARATASLTWKRNCEELKENILPFFLDEALWTYNSTRIFNIVHRCSLRRKAYNNQL